MNCSTSESDKRDLEQKRGPSADSTTVTPLLRLTNLQNKSPPPTPPPRVVRYTASREKLFFVLERVAGQSIFHLFCAQLLSLSVK